MNCVFCAIAAGDDEAVVLWEDEDLVVFLDRSPIREGHAHVMPRTHIETFELMPPELARRVITAGQELARRQKEVYGVDRVAFVFTGGDVPHVHAHVIPMYAKTDVTSALYLIASEEPLWSADHLRTSIEDRQRVRANLGTPVLRAGDKRSAMYAPTRGVRTHSEALHLTAAFGARR